MGFPPSVEVTLGRLDLESPRGFWSESSWLRSWFRSWSSRGVCFGGVGDHWDAGLVQAPFTSRCLSLGRPPLHASSAFGSPRAFKLRGGGESWVGGGIAGKCRGTPWWWARTAARRTESIARAPNPEASAQARASGPGPSRRRGGSLLPIQLQTSCKLSCKPVANSVANPVANLACALIPNKKLHHAQAKTNPFLHFHKSSNFTTVRLLARNIKIKMYAGGLQLGLQLSLQLVCN